MFDFSTILTSILYPISTHWCWGDGGWLSGMGFYDFAGSGVVHVSGGIHALIGKIEQLCSKNYQDRIHVNSVEALLTFFLRFHRSRPKNG